MRLVIVAMLTLLLISSVAFAQSAKLTPDYPEGSQGRSISEIYLSLGVLLFGLIILGLEVGVLLRQNQGWGINSTRIVGLTLVVVSGVFLITAGYSETQIAPMIGLLGTIVGYLLGKSDSPSKPSK